VYCTVNAPVFDPDEGKIRLPFAELSDHPLAFATETLNVALPNCCTDEGPLIEAAAPGVMLKTVTASSLEPQALAACAE
jgi:hypothetical protein